MCHVWFFQCVLGDSGRRSKFLAGRPALIRGQVRELGINLLGVPAGGEVCRRCTRC